VYNIFNAFKLSIEDKKNMIIYVLHFFLKDHCFLALIISFEHFKVTLFPLFFQVRHNVRQHFLGSDTLKLIYDVITWFSTQIAICYTVVPFVLLAVGPSLKFYRSVMHLHQYVSTPDVSDPCR